MSDFSQEISHNAELIKRSIQKHEKKLGNVIDEQRMSQDIQRALSKISTITDAQKKRDALKSLQQKLTPIVHQLSNINTTRKEQLLTLRDTLYHHIGSILFPQRNKTLIEKAYIAKENIITLPNNSVIIKHNGLAVRAQISESQNKLQIHTLSVGKFELKAIQIPPDGLQHLLNTITSAAQIADARLSRKISAIPVSYHSIQRLEFSINKKPYTIIGGRIYTVKSASTSNRTLVDISTHRQSNALFLGTSLYLTEGQKKRSTTKIYRDGYLNEESIKYRNGTQISREYDVKKNQHFVRRLIRSYERKGFKKSVAQTFSTDCKPFSETVTIERGKKRIMREYEIQGKRKNLTLEEISQNDVLISRTSHNQYGNAQKKWGHTTVERYKKGKLFSTRKTQFETSNGRKKIISDAEYQNGKIVRSMQQRNGMIRHNNYDYQKGIITTKLNGNTICRSHFDKTKGIEHVKYREMVLDKGKTISTYDREKIKNPKLAGSPTQYLQYVARILGNPDNIARFISFFMHYKNDDGDPLKRIKQVGKEWWQLAKTTITLIENGYFRGDCDDFAFLAKKLINLQLQMGLRKGHPAFAISIPEHALCTWITVKGSGKNKRYFARSIGTFGYEKPKKGYARLEDAVNSIMVKYQYAGLGLKKGINFKVDPDQVGVLSIPKRGERKYSYRPVEYLVDNSVRNLDALFDTKDYATAQKILKKLVRKYPRRNYFTFKLAETYYRMRQPREAERLYRKLLTSRTIQPAMFFEVLNHLFGCDTHKEHTMQLMSRYFNHIHLTKTNIGHILTGIGKYPLLQISKATFAKLTQFILEQFTTDVSHHALLAAHLSNLGHNDLAQQLAARIISSSYVTEHHREIAFSILMQQKFSFKEHTTKLEQLIKISKEKDSLAQILCTIYLRRNDLSAANKLLNTYVSSFRNRTLKSLEKQLSLAQAKIAGNIDGQARTIDQLQLLINTNADLPITTYTSVFKYLEQHNQTGKIAQLAQLFIERHPLALSALPTRTIHVVLNHMIQPKKIIQYALYNILFSRPGYTLTRNDYLAYITLCKDLRLNNKAKHYSGELTEKQSSSKQQALQQAPKLIQSKKYVEAQKILEAASRFNPENEKILLLLIQTYFGAHTNTKLLEAARSYYSHFSKKKSIPLSTATLNALGRSIQLSPEIRAFYYKCLINSFPAKPSTHQRIVVNQFLTLAKSSADPSFFTYARKFGFWNDELLAAKHDALSLKFADANMRIHDVPGKAQFIVESHGKKLTVAVNMENGVLTYTIAGLSISVAVLSDVIKLANFTNYIRKKYKNRKVESGAENKAFYVSANLLYFAKPWWDEYLFKNEKFWEQIGIYQASDRTQYAGYISKIYKT